MDRYLEELNEKQREAVLTPEGPVLIVAGAGSGKTKTLTSRVVHILRTRNDINPYNILAVTFTNKAAGEMKERIGKSLGIDPLAANFPVVGTFHSICIRMLRREYLCTPMQTSNFVIYNDTDQHSLLKTICTQLNIPEKQFPPKSFQYAIDKAKSNLETPEIVSARADKAIGFSKHFADVYKLYQEELYKAKAVDFSEIIMLAVMVLKNNPEVLKKYQNLFKYIMVDEYQDTNKAQYMFVRMLSAGHENICVVGDEDQSIYRWRGADIRNIMDFEKDFKGAKVVKLEQNYRSTSTIINASTAVIKKNTERRDKTLWTSNEKGDKIRLVYLDDDKGEADFVSKEIKNVLNSGISPKDIAVFYRMNSQSRSLVDASRRENIKHKVIGGLRFYDRKEIRDILSWFKMLINPFDSVAIKRVLQIPPAVVGKKSIEKIEGQAIIDNSTFWEALIKSSTKEAENLQGARKKKVADFLETVKEFMILANTEKPTTVYNTILNKTGYIKMLQEEKTDEALSRIDNLQEFGIVIEDFEKRMGEEAKLLDFLEEITLSSDLDSMDETDEVVSLMTVHTSKGLEFPYVFVVGLEDGVFPLKRGAMESEDPAEMEEERRLCYVAMTRAKRKLYLSRCQMRRVYGNIQHNPASRFLEEIPEEYYEVIDNRNFSFDFMFEGKNKENDSDETETNYSYNYEGSFAQRPKPAGNGYSQFKSFGKSQSTGGFGSGYGSSAVKKDTSQIGRQVPFAKPTSTVTGTSDFGGDYQVGRRVKHQEYGEGIIRQSEGSALNTKITVEFSGRTIKKFIVKYANLELL